MSEALGTARLSRPPRMTPWGQSAYPPTQIARLHDELDAIGQDAGTVLRAAQVSLSDVRSPDTRVTLQQILAAYHAVAALAPNAEFAFLSGTRNKVTFFGMYGFAIMSAPDLGTMLRFIVEAQDLSAALVGLRVTHSPGEIAIRIDPFVHQNIDARIHRFLVEETLGLLVTSFRDLVGSSFSPLQIRVALPAHLSTSRAAELAGAPVHFEQQRTEFVFDDAWLTEHLQFGNVVVHGSVSRTCHELLRELDATNGLTGRVGEVLIAHRGVPQPIDDIAERFEMSARSLRRKLQDEGTGYRHISDTVRTQIAMKYLRDTTLSVEHISAVLGFDNSANFRRAFRRWTAHTPAEYRTSTALYP